MKSRPTNRTPGQPSNRLPGSLDFPARDRIPRASLGGISMRFGRWCVSILCAVLSLCALGAVGAAAQTLKDDSLKGMKWRLIGPFRGGRVLAVAGVANQPNIFYFGAVAGGVWKTTDGGLTWSPIFDKQPVSSIGAIAVAPSDPNIIYVGTGEACIRGDISFGNGVY